MKNTDQYGRRGFLAAVSKGTALLAGLLLKPLRNIAAQTPLTSSPATTRVRRLLDQGWRFTKGDPSGSASLLYDVRPQPAARGAEPPPPQPSVPVVKSWILPSGNQFVNNPAKR